MANDSTDGIILMARLLLAALFLIFNWRKLVDYSGTVGRMVQDGAPLPALSAVIAIFMELPVTFAVSFGRSHVLRLHLWLYTRLRQRSSRIAIGHCQMRIELTAWKDSTRTCVSWDVFCCFISRVRDAIRSMPYLDCKNLLLSGQSITSCARPMRIRKTPRHVLP
jgi:DoxX